MLTAEELLAVGADNLLAIWDDLPYICKRSIVCHPRTEPRLLWHAIRSQPGEWLWPFEYAGHSVPEQIMWDVFLFLAFGIHYFSRHLVRHASVSADLLLVLTELGDLNARFEVSQLKNASEETLERLSRDADRDVRRAARETLRARRANQRTSAAASATVRPGSLSEELP